MAGRGRRRPNHDSDLFRVFGLTKMRILLAATIVGYNLEAIRSFAGKKTADRTAAPSKRTRKKRRKGTWADVIDPEQSTSGPSGFGRSPPPT